MAQGTITVTSHYGNKDLDEIIKKLVYEKLSIDRVVKSADRRIQTVAVTADADMFRRITSVGEGIRAGRPFSQFGAEVEEIFRRIIPR